VLAALRAVFTPVRDIKEGAELWVRDKDDRAAVAAVASMSELAGDEEAAMRHKTEIFFARHVLPIIAAEGADSPLRQAVGRDWKGKLSPIATV